MSAGRAKDGGLATASGTPAVCAGEPDLWSGPRRLLETESGRELVLGGGAVAVSGPSCWPMLLILLFRGGKREASWPAPIGNVDVRFCGAGEAAETLIFRGPATVGGAFPGFWAGWANGRDDEGPNVAA